MIATQLILSHRFYLNFDLIGLPNIDALTALPDFRSEEGLFKQIQQIKDFEPEKIIIQTFEPENQVLKSAIEGNYENFYGSGLPTRKIFFFPPFLRLV